MLVLSRNEGSTIYGGVCLTDDLEETFDHKIEIAELGSRDRKNYAILKITSRKANVEEMQTVRLDAFNDCYNINTDVGLFLIGMRTMKGDNGKVSYQARIGVMAPRHYKVVRDDAIKKVA